MEISKQVTEERKWVKLSEGVLDKKKEKEKGKKKKNKELEFQDMWYRCAHTHTKIHTIIYIHSHTYTHHIYTGTNIHKRCQRITEKLCSLMGISSLPLSDVFTAVSIAITLLYFGLYHVPLIENSKHFRKSVHTQLHFIYTGKKGEMRFYRTFNFSAVSWGKRILVHNCDQFHL